MLLLHSYLRWIVVIVMLYAVVRMWWGLIGKREWSAQDGMIARVFAMLVSVQLIIGLVLYALPAGLAAVARQDIGAAMGVTELRFALVEHPLMMIIAIALVHIGSSRARKADGSARKFRLAAIFFTIATLLIFASIPWWQPLFRGL